MYTFAAPARLEWMLNFRHARQDLLRTDTDFMAVGTTTNEALHCELNRAFDQVHGMYKETLQLRLSMFQLYKLLPHNRARYGRGLTSRNQGLMLNRCVESVLPWTPRTWKAWCSGLGKREKANLPLKAAKVSGAALVRTAVRARPASAAEALLMRPAASRT